jgi:hypothetical protein
VGQAKLFQAKKQTYSGTNDCWYEIADGVSNSKCIPGMYWGHPRVVGRLDNTLVKFGSGTTMGTFTNVKNRAQTSETWNNMGYSSFESYCIETSYTDIHAHTAVPGITTLHIGPPFSETSNCSGSSPQDLGG